MSIIIGIDIGGSTTKIVGLQDGAILSPLQVKATDPVASLFGAFGKFTAQNNLRLTDIRQIAITGVGSSFIDKPIYGLPTAKVEEFLSNGLGGLHLSGFNKAIIVSMGTGTALVYADEHEIFHLGGTGIGGGTLMGLSNKILNIRDIQVLLDTAKTGNLNNVDLMVGDISKDELPSLPPRTTASNFGKLSDSASAGDVALGLLNLVFQAIGTNAIFAVQNRDVAEIVLIGNLSSIPGCADFFQVFTGLHGYTFTIPQYSEYATAVGAALAFLRGKRIESIMEG